MTGDKTASVPAAEWRIPARPIPPGVGIRPIRGLVWNEVMKVVRLYQASFPPETQIEPAVLLRLTPQVTHEVGGWVFQVAERGDDVLGFAVAYHASGTHLGYLAYLAVAESWRGRGIASALRQRLQIASSGLVLALHPIGALGRVRVLQPAVRIRDSCAV